MKITLQIDGKEKTFVCQTIKARMFRKVLEMRKKMNFEDLSADELDYLVDFVCEVFGRQFTVDEFYDGLPVDKLIPTIQKTFETIAGSANGEGNVGK